MIRLGIAVVAGFAAVWAVTSWPLPHLVWACAVYAYLAVLYAGFRSRRVQRREAAIRRATERAAQTRRAVAERAAGLGYRPPVDAVDAEYEELCEREGRRP